MTPAALTTAAEPRLGALLAPAGRPGERVALRLGDDELRYGELATIVDRLAQRILTVAGGPRAARGLQGARIAVIAPNQPALVAGVFAAFRLGGVAVPLSARLRERELEQALVDAEPPVCVVVRAHGGYSFADLLERLRPRLPTLRAVLFLDARGRPESETRLAASREAEPLEPGIAAILYTSGTTGAAKGALVTHRRESEAAPFLASLLGLDKDDEVVLAVPLAHAFGLTCLLATLAAGATAVLVDSTFSNRGLLAAIEDERTSVLHGSPTLFASLLKARPESLPGIRSGFVAGASCPPELLRRLDHAGTRILNLYGLTETGAVSCCRPDDPPGLRHETVGRPLPGVAVRIAGEDGSRGLIEVRGDGMTGYHRQPEETARAFAGGWFTTGDLGELRDGYLRIVGREKEIVVVGGFTVHPAEVEAALAEHPAVDQAAVVGVPSESTGEALHAFVLPRSGAAVTSTELVRWLRPRLAGYKLPYGLEIVEELPLLASGKPDRRLLARMAAGRGLDGKARR